MSVECGWKRSDERLCVKLGEKSEDQWAGRFSCGRPCEHLYDCGIHPCTEVYCRNQTIKHVLTRRRNAMITLSVLFTAPCPRRKSQLAPATPPLSVSFQAIRDRTASRQSPLVGLGARNPGHADMLALERVILALARRVMRRSSVRVDVARVC